MGRYCEEKWNFLNFFLLMTVLHILQALCEHHAWPFQLFMSLWHISIENLYWTNFSCSTEGVPTCSHVLETAQGLEARVFKKIKFDAYKILAFRRLYLVWLAHGWTWCHLQCKRYDLNVHYLIIFPNFFWKSIVFKFGVKTP